MALPKSDARNAPEPGSSRRGLALPTAPVMSIFAGTAVVGILFGLAAFSALRMVSHQMESVVSEHADAVIAVERLTTLSERIGRTARAFVLSGDERFLAEHRGARQLFEEKVRELRTELSDDAPRHLLDAIRRTEDEHAAITARIIESRRRGQLAASEVAERFMSEVQPFRDRLDGTLAALGQYEINAFTEARRAAVAKTERTMHLLVAGAIAALVVAGLLAAMLSRALARVRRSRVELEQLMRQLEVANRDLEAFAGRVSHDLRNILSPLTLGVARLRAHRESPEYVDTFADRVSRCTDRAQGLIESLLAFARAGQPAETNARAALRPAVEGALEDVDELRRRVDAEVEVDVEPATVACSPSLLHAVLLNLLSNALKFLEGRPERRVEISARASATHCEIAVEDTGPGIPAAVREQIFRPFFRAPHTTAPGTGIGLATVQRIVEAHGGRVWVDSLPGAWTRFTVRLPLGGSEASRGTEGASRASAAPHPEAG